MPRRSVSALAGIALAALALTGCATGGVNYGAGGPGGDEEPGAGDLSVGAAWLAGGSLIAVVTEGSSTCTPFVEDAVLDEGVLVVTLTEDTGEADQACTADLVKRGTVVGVPDGVKPGTGIDIQVTIDGAFGETSLEGYAGGSVDEYTPSAGWIDDQTFALLTWGSSSCAPQVESATAASPDAIELTFVDPPADQVCTMDMAPRVAVVTVDGEVSRDAAITVSGGGADRGPSSSIPID